MTPSAFDSFYKSLRPKSESYPYLKNDIQEYIRLLIAMNGDHSIICESGVISAMAIATNKGQMSCNTRLEAMIPTEEMSHLVKINNKLFEAAFVSARERNAIAKIVGQMI